MISVCIPTYNGERFIKEQIDSILPQLEDSDEVIISDDSSTDNTIVILKKYKDPRIKLLLNNNFKSPIYNLENALKHAKGDYIFLSDQDDVWNKNKVNIMLKSLKKYDCVVSDAEVVDKNLNTIYPSFFEKRKSKKGLLRNIIKNNYIGCCMAFRKSILQYALPFPENLPMHDIWLGLISEKHGRCVFIDDKLIKYRRHGNNVSLTGEKSSNSLYVKLKIRFNIIKALLFMK